MLVKDILNEMIYSTYNNVDLEDYKQGYRMEVEPDVERSKHESNMGVKRVQIFLNDSDLETFKNNNVNPDVVIDHVNVIYAYTFNMKQQHGAEFMSSLKGRNPISKGEVKSLMKPQNIDEAIKEGIHKILFPTDYLYQTKGGRNNPNSTILEFANLCHSSTPKLIIPVSSSAGLTEKIAVALNSNIKNSQIVKNINKIKNDALINMLQQIAEEDKNSIILLQKEIDKHPMDVKTNKTLQKQIRDLTNNIDKINNDIKNKTFSSVKSYYGAWREMNIKNRPNIFIADSNQSINNMDIIIVDDNINSQITINMAVKSIYAAGLRPKSITGVCLHKFQSKKINNV